MPSKLSPSLLCPTEKVTEDQLATDAALLDFGRTIQAPSRRSFFSSFAAAAAAAAAAGMLGAAAPARAQAAGPSIVDVLNFALNLEYLEANLYLSASGGGTLLPEEGGGAPIKGAPKGIQFDSQTMATAQNLANDERKHIEVLRAAIVGLGGTPISQPPLDYTLGGKMLIQTQAQFLTVARQFTAVGNSAYTGAAQFLISSDAVLTVAAQILGAESQHVGAINYLCCLQGVVSPPVDSLDVPPTPPNSFLTLTSATDPTMPALAIPRTPQQVLGIVYGVSTPATTTPPAGVTSGGFFPKGLNGSVKST